MKVKARAPQQGSSCCSGDPPIREIKAQAVVPRSDAFPGDPLLGCLALLLHADTPCLSYHSAASSSL